MRRPTNRSKLVIFNRLLWITIVACISLIVLSWLQGLYWLCFMEFGLAVVSAWAIYKVKHEQVSQKQFHKLATTYLLVLFGITIYAMIRQGSSPSVYIWTFVVPVLCYQLLGLKRGLQVTAGFIGISAALYCYRYSANVAVIAMFDFINITICLLSIWALSHAYEKSYMLTEVELTNLAYRDALTSLYNRANLKDLFDSELKKRANTPHNLGIIILDIDDFKKINDTYGHDIGDVVLVKIAECLTTHVAKSDYVFRLGGEEFCVFTTKSSPKDTINLARRLIQQISYIKVAVRDETVHVTSSAGVANHPSDGEGLSEVLKAADERLYISKHNGKNQVTYVSA